MRREGCPLLAETNSVVKEAGASRGLDASSFCRSVHVEVVAVSPPTQTLSFSRLTYPLISIPPKAASWFLVHFTRSFNHISHQSLLLRVINHAQRTASSLRLRIAFRLREREADATSPEAGLCVNYQPQQCFVHSQCRRAEPLLCTTDALWCSARITPCDGTEPARHTLWESSSELR